MYIPADFQSKTSLQVSKLYVMCFLHVTQINTPFSLTSLFQELSCLVLRYSINTKCWKESDQVFNHNSRISQEANWESAPVPAVSRLPPGVCVCVFVCVSVCVHTLVQESSFPTEKSFVTAYGWTWKFSCSFFSQVLYLASRYMLYFWPLWHSGDKLKLVDDKGRIYRKGIGTF